VFLWKPSVPSSNVTATIQRRVMGWMMGEGGRVMKTMAAKWTKHLVRKRLVGSQAQLNEGWSAGSDRRHAKLASMVSQPVGSVG
jgi:hypothetical protein